MRLKRSPTLELANRVAEARKAGKRAFSLSTPSFPRDAPPFTPPEGWTLLSPARGMPALREAARPALFGKWNLPRHEVLVTAGAKAAIFAVLRAALAPGASLLIIGPFWPSYEDLASAAALNARPIYTDSRREFALDIGQIERLALDTGARAIILSNPNNPTGRVYRGEELNALLGLAEKHGILLIVDESFSGLTFDDALWKSSVTRDSDQLVIVNSFSKNLHLQGLRVGAVLLPPALMEPSTIVHQTVISAAPSLSQLVALDFLRSGLHEPDYRPQRAIMRDFIVKRGWRFHEQSGTFYFFPELPNLDAFRRDAAARDIYMLSGDAFGAPYGRHVRLCFAKPVEELEEILDSVDSPGVAVS